MLLDPASAPGPARTPVDGGPAPVPVVPHVRAGSAVDAKRLRARLHAYLDAVGHGTMHLAALLETARQRAIFLVLTAPEGTYFGTWLQFAVCPRPHGLGLDLAALEALSQDVRRQGPAARAAALLARPARLGSLAAPAARGAAAPTKGTAYWQERLRRDAPDQLARIASGQLSLMQAVRRLGWASPTSSVVLTPIGVARLIVTRFTPAERREIVALVEDPSRLPDPQSRRRAYDRAAAALTPEARAAQVQHREDVRAQARVRDAARQRERRASSAAPAGAGAAAA